jgi:hypothetical protein
MPFTKNNFVKIDQTYPFFSYLSIFSQHITHYTQVLQNLQT